MNQNSNCLIFFFNYLQIKHSTVTFKWKNALCWEISNNEIYQKHSPIAHCAWNAHFERRVQSRASWWAGAFERGVCGRRVCPALVWFATIKLCKQSELSAGGTWNSTRLSSSILDSSERAASRARGDQRLFAAHSSAAPIPVVHQMSVCDKPNAHHVLRSWEKMTAEPKQLYILILNSILTLFRKLILTKLSERNINDIKHQICIFNSVNKDNC